MWELAWLVWALLALAAVLSLSLIQPKADPS